MIHQAFGVEVVQLSDGHQPLAARPELRQPGLVRQKRHLFAYLHLGVFAGAPTKPVNFHVALCRCHQAGDNA